MKTSCRSTTVKKKKNTNACTVRGRKTCLGEGRVNSIKIYYVGTF